MKVYITSMAHMPRVRAVSFAQSLDREVVVVVDDEEQADRMSSAYPGVTVVSTGIPSPGMYGAAIKRQWVQDNLLFDGEHYIWLDDNVSHCVGLSPDFDGDFPWDFDFHKEMNRELEPWEVNRYLARVEQRMIELGTTMGGFAIEANPFFRKNEEQFWGYVRTRFAVCFNDGITWYPFEECMLEDFVRTVEVVARYGCIYVNRWCRAEKPRFEEGGIGTLEDRMPELIRANQWLMDKYPGLLRELRPEQLTFAKRSQKTIDAWRREHGYHQA